VLEEKYRDKDIVDIWLLYSTMVETTLTKCGNNMEQYIQTLGNIFVQFADAGKAQAEDFQGEQLLAGLGAEYFPLKMTLVAMEPRELTFDKLAKSLRRLTQYDGTTKTSPEATSGNVMITKSEKSQAEGNSVKENQKNGKNSKVCWYCEKVGHFKVECKSRVSGKPPKRRTTGRQRVHQVKN
jgi:hypothetical protein